MTPETLCEYKTKEVHLTLSEVALLRRLAPSITISPAGTAEPGLFQLTPGAVVGAVNLGSKSLVIRPKIPIEHLMFLISYAMDATHWQPTTIRFDPTTSLLESIVPAFAHHVGVALRRGVLQGYQTKDDAAATVRGRIRFADQVGRRNNALLPIEVRYDEFTEDIEPNRLIKAALQTLRKMKIRSHRNRSTLRVFDAALEAVSLVGYHPRSLPDIHYNRLNERYRGAVELAKLILASTSLELNDGSVAGSAFLVDMNVVFENFVVTALRESLGLSSRAFPQNASGKSLRMDEAGTIGLQPDISWWDGPHCRFVGDVKYKKVNVAGIKHPDLYQLLAYATAADLPGGLMIYAAGEGVPAVHRVLYASKQLEVVSLALDASPADILTRIGEIGRRIREYRDLASRTPAFN